MQVNQCWDSLVPRCKSSGILVQDEAPSSSNTRSHRVPDTIERGSRREMEVGRRKKRILREGEKNIEKSSLQRETISSAFVTGAKTVQSQH